MKKIASIILSGLVCASCVDTVLLPDDKTVEEDFWQTKSDVSSMVNGAYASMATSALQQRLVVWTSRSDELNVNSALNNSALNQIQSANIMTTNSYCDWGGLYSVINNCNLVLNKSADVMDIDPNYLEGDHRNYVGQMKALRALAYFYLVRVFRDVPLVLEPYKVSSQDMNVIQVAPGVVIDQIIADLEEVKDYTLSTQSLNDWTRCGYFTRDGICALLADVYLWKASVYGDESCYDKCIQLCNTIRDRRSAANPQNGMGGGYYGNTLQTLDDDGYDLTEYNNWFGNLFTKGNGDESLFELQFTNNEGLGIIYNKTENKATALPTFYTNPTYATLSTGENYVFNHANYANDVRGFESIYDFNGAAEEGIMVRKFVAENSLALMSGTLASESRIGRNYTGYDQNWIFYRVTDVMLMKAEALVQKALLQFNANQDLLAQVENAATADDSLTYALQLQEVSKVIAGYNVTAARQAQITSTRARNDGLSEIDSTKYALTNLQYAEGVDKGVFSRLQINLFKAFETTAKELEIEIMNERARELCFEGKRWFDMLRYNYRHTTGVNYDVTLAQQGGNFAKNYDEMLKLIARKYTSGGSGVTAKMPTEPYLYLPIKQSEMDVNPNLVQNPVYTDGGTTEKNY